MPRWYDTIHGKSSTRCEKPRGVEDGDHAHRVLDLGALDHAHHLGEGELAPLDEFRRVGRAGRGAEIARQVEVRRLAHDALRGVEVAELDEFARLASRLFRELALGGVLEAFAGVHRARRDLPVEALRDVTVL